MSKNGRIDQKSQRQRPEGEEEGAHPLHVQPPAPFRAAPWILHDPDVASLSKEFLHLSLLSACHGGQLIHPFFICEFHHLHLLLLQVGVLPLLCLEVDLLHPVVALQLVQPFQLLPGKRNFRS